MRKKSIFVKYFTAFFGLLIVFLFIAGCVFNYFMMNYTESEISKASIGKLKIIKSINDLLADVIMKDTLRLSMNDKLISISGIEKTYQSVARNTASVIKLEKAVNELGSFIRTNDMLQSVYLYLDDTDYIVASDDGVVVKDSFKDMNWYEYYLDFREKRSSKYWMDSRLQGGGTDAFPAGGNTPRGNQHVITYFFPLASYISSLNGALVVNIYEDDICQLINDNDFENEGYVCIINRQGNIISHMDKTQIGTSIENQPYSKQILGGNADNGYLVADIGKKKQLITFYKSDFNNWIYIGIFPLDPLIQRSTALRMSVLYILAGLTAFGGILSYFLSKKIYNPVNMLVKNIKSRKGFDIKRDENEMTLLSRAFATLVRQEDQWFEFINKNRSAIKNNYLAGLIKGEADDGMEKELTGETFPYAGFICAIMVIDNLEDFLAKNSQEQQRYIDMLILNICEDIFNSQFRCSGLINGANTMAVIINTDEFIQDETAAMLRANFKRIQQEMSKVLENSISVGIGKFREGISGIKDSYNEAVEAHRYRALYGRGCIVSWGDEEQREIKYYYPFIREKHIMNYLSLGMIDEIVKEINELINEISERNDISYDNVTQIFNQLTGGVIRYLVDSNVKINDVFGAGRNVYKELLKIETLEETGSWLINIFKTVIEYNKKANDYKKSHKDVMLDYIHTNYMKNIDINALADHVGISYSYVRLIFKKEIGKSIVDYINGIRVKEAKKLLIQSRLNITDIALRLGYNCDQSFNRNFKKIEGITPGEYREMNGGT